MGYYWSGVDVEEEIHAAFACFAVPAIRPGLESQRDNFTKLFGVR
jgi:hypothetical protein